MSLIFQLLDFLLRNLQPQDSILEGCMNSHGSGTGIMEIPKFIVIATAKFHFREERAWEMTPRKFSLLNDAYRVVNGLKKKEEYASLLSLP